MKTALITGTSSGIGAALAKGTLDNGDRVFGVSRCLPKWLINHPNYVHLTLDLAAHQSAATLLHQWLVHEHGVMQLDRVFLNAGQFSQRIAPLSDTPQAELDAIMNINVWANKAVLDVLFAAAICIGVCVVSSSIAGVRTRAGNGGYALSKATLNMLMSLYAAEHPNVHFLVLGLCNVRTRLAQQIGSLPLEGDFPDIARLRERGVQPGYLSTPEQRAAQLLQLLDTERYKQVGSGEFTEIRTLLQDIGDRLDAAATSTPTSA